MLIITIIVMIILATAIIISLGNNNIISQANTAVKDTNLKNIEEAANIALGQVLLDNNEPDIGKIREKMKDNGISDTELNKYNITYNNNGKVDVTVKGEEQNLFPISVSVGSDATLTWTNESSGGKFTITGTDATTDFECSDSSTIIPILAQAVNTKLGVNDSSMVGYGIVSYAIKTLDRIAHTEFNEDNIIEGLRLIIEAQEIELSSAETAAVENNIRSVKNIKEIKFDEGITRIGTSFICQLSNIDTLTLPSTLIEISSVAFEETSFTSIIIPESVTTIGSYAFYEGSTINMVKENGTGMTLPEDFESIYTVNWGYTE